MGAGASASVGASAVIDERAAFKTMEREYLKRGGSCMSDPAAGIAELKAIWLQLLAGETVDDDRTLVEIVGPEQFKVEKQNVIDTVLRMQARRKEAEKLSTGEDYVVDGVHYNTAKDAALEREFASAAYGDDVYKQAVTRVGEEADGGDYTVLNSVEEANAREGKWERVNADPVFYVNNMTAEVCFLRPDAVDEAQEKEALAEQEKEQARGFKSMHILKMPDELDAIWASGKTPLIIDESSSDNPQTVAFFSYKGVVLDAKPIGLGFSKTGRATADILEEFRAKLVAALKAGNKRVAVDLGSFAPNFKELLKTKKNMELFPIQVFRHGDISKRIHAKRIFRDEDKEPPGPRGKVNVKDGVRVCLITHVSPDDALDHLKDSIPLEHMQPLHVWSRA